MINNNYVPLSNNIEFLSQNVETILEDIASNVNFSHELSSLSSDARKEIIKKLWPQEKKLDGETCKVLVSYFLADLSEDQQISLIDFVQSLHSAYPIQWRDRMKDLLERTSVLYLRPLQKLNTILDVRVQQVVPALVTEETTRRTLSQMRFLLLSGYVEMLEDEEVKPKWPAALQFLYQMVLFEKDFSATRKYVATVVDRLCLFLIHNAFGSDKAGYLTAKPPERGISMVLRGIKVPTSDLFASFKEANGFTSDLQWAIHFGCYYYGVGVTKDPTTGWNNLLTAAERGDQNALQAAVNLYLLARAEERERCLNLLLKDSEESFAVNLLVKCYSDTAFTPDEKMQIFTHFTSDTKRFQKLELERQKQLLIESGSDSVIRNSPSYRALFVLLIEDLSKNSPHSLFQFLQINWVQTFATLCREEAIQSKIVDLLKRESSLPSSIEELDGWLFLMTQYNALLSEEVYTAFRRKNGRMMYNAISFGSVWMNRQKHNAKASERITDGYSKDFEKEMNKVE